MTTNYVSFLATQFAAYVSFRRSMGYKFDRQIYILRHFDRVIQRELEVPGPITRSVVAAYLRTIGGLRPLTRRVRLSAIRQFLIYLNKFEHATYIPERAMLPKGAAPRPPYIYSDDEIRALTREALRFPPRYPARRWRLYSTLIGFLYVAGLRISEALTLNLADLDLGQALVHIRKTKFHKSRIVPLAPSSCKALGEYLVERAERGYATSPSSPVFVSEGGTPLPYSTVCHAFRKIAEMAEVRTPPGRPSPRLHDLRHTAAVRRLYLWYRGGQDVQVLLPVLVTFLGHSAVRCTEVYLTATAELLEEASIRFEGKFPVAASDQERIKS